MPEVLTHSFPEGTQSPFLPGTNVQFAWDSTSLGWLKTCPRLYQYSMIEGWRHRGNSVHLDFGLWYHDGLETYDKLRSDGLDHEDAVREVVLHCLKLTWVYETEPAPPEDGLPPGAVNIIPGTGTPWRSDHNLKTRETLIRSVIWYLEQFGPNDSATTIQLVNGKPAVELSFRLEMDWGPGWSDKHGPSSIGGVALQPYVICGHLDRVVEFQ